MATQFFSFDDEFTQILFFVIFKHTQTTHFKILEIFCFT